MIFNEEYHQEYLAPQPIRVQFSFSENNSENTNNSYTSVLTIEKYQLTVMVEDILIYYICKLLITPSISFIVGSVLFKKDSLYYLGA